METVGNHWQAEMPFLGAVRAPSVCAADIVPRLSDLSSLRLAVQESGHDDYEIADKLGISHGYMSKVLHGTAGLYGKRLVKFMRITNSIAPLQWLAEQMGCDVVLRDSRAAEVAALKSRLQELERAA
jgi:hypothetical protein